MLWGKLTATPVMLGIKKPVFNRKYVHITGKMPDVEAMKRRQNILSVCMTLQASAAIPR